MLDVSTLTDTGTVGGNTVGLSPAGESTMDVTMAEVVDVGEVLLKFISILAL